MVSCARLCFDTVERFAGEAVRLLWGFVRHAVSGRCVTAVVWRPVAGAGGGEEVIRVWAAVGLFR